jgi:hypothetical protein
MSLLNEHKSFRQNIIIDLNLDIPCWISCRMCDFIWYFRNMTTQITPPRIRAMESVVDNIEISLVFPLRLVTTHHTMQKNFSLCNSRTKCFYHKQITYDSNIKLQTMTIQSYENLPLVHLRINVTWCRFTKCTS